MSRFGFSNFATPEDIGEAFRVSGYKLLRGKLKDGRNAVIPLTPEGAALFRELGCKSDSEMFAKYISIPGNDLENEDEDQS